MKLNFKVLGAGLLSAGPVLLNLAPAQAIWWLGIGCVVVGPVLMAVEPVDSKDHEPVSKGKTSRATKQRNRKQSHDG